MKAPRTPAGLSMLVALGPKPVPQDVIDLICDIEDQAASVRIAALDEAIDAVADALNAWDRGEAPRPDTHRHWSRIVRALSGEADARSSHSDVSADHRAALDVERLARALCYLHDPKPEQAGLTIETIHVDDACRSDARWIAGYLAARLASREEPTE